MYSCGIKNKAEKGYTETGNCFCLGLLHQAALLCSTIVELKALIFRIFEFYQGEVFKIPSTNLVIYVCTAFPILEFVDDLITKSGLTVCKVAERVLIHCFQSFETFACTTREAIARKIANSTAVNIYFNNKRKIFTDSVAADGVKIMFILGLCYV